MSKRLLLMILIPVMVGCSTGARMSPEDVFEELAEEGIFVQEVDYQDFHLQRGDLFNKGTDYSLALTESIELDRVRTWLEWLASSFRAYRTT